VQYIFLYCSCGCARGLSPAGYASAVHTAICSSHRLPAAALLFHSAQVPRQHQQKMSQPKPKQAASSKQALVWFSKRQSL
jgi:hypothetical protein